MNLTKTHGSPIIVAALSVIAMMFTVGCDNQKQVTSDDRKLPPTKVMVASADEKKTSESSPIPTVERAKSSKSILPAVAQKPVASAQQKAAPAPKQQPAAQPKQEPAARSVLTKEQAIANITQATGRVFFDEKSPGKLFRIRFDNPNITDSVMGNLTPLSEIEELVIRYPSNVTDAGFVHVDGLKNLSYVDLEGTSISDAGLAHLEGLTSLKRLRLINTRVTSAGLAHLKGLAELRTLLLSFTEVGDDGLVHLEKLSNLQELELDDTKVTEAGVNRLKKSLPQCKILWSPSGGATATSNQSAIPTNAAATPAVAPATATGDWPGWRGPNRDGRCTETGLLQEWPADGPPLLWTIRGIGAGFATVAIADGRMFTTGRFGGKQPGNYLLCLEPDTGKKRWERFIAEDEKNLPLSTPTIDGDRVYALAHEGELLCVEAASGAEVWRRNLIKDFGGDYQARNIGGGYSESVLIDGDRLICTPGGKDAALACLNKKTGETIWKVPLPADIGPQGSDQAGFSSPVISNACGIRQYVQMTGRGLISVSADNGKVLWTYNRIANKWTNIPTPLVVGDYVFASTMHSGDPDTGTALLKLVPDKDGVKAEEVYRLPHRVAANHHGGMVLLGDYIYMGHGYNRGFPLCLEMMTGKIVWKPGRGPGTGSAAVLYADGNLYFRYEDGTMALIEATPKAYNLKGTFKPPADTDMEWAHPVINAGRLYLRGKDRLLCYDVLAKNSK